ncbi:hypothetical protein EPUS_02775 [Endocarpon pusillum Z07020]|uniref:Glycosyltransferase 2 n=1 Tax=Endocarpon pusillum (strain Z07020 / HMAS-L-300199) TaxID=1263415 RepID=U1HHI8_ENDPU|nr:uncharacterized protein EPUS_02775 [Endocarpon pusillum Z07020]ERF68319.1 hypothetical protein EPUS_02775 [Endocarpon pusillum Z07020]
MSLQRRYITVDEELGKKDDDHREGRRSAMSSPTTTNFTWRGPRRKRILLAIAVFSILYIFFKNLPKDAATATRRQGLKSPTVGSSRQAPSAPKGPPPRSDSSVDERRYFEGPIKYYRLSASFGAGLGPVHDNRNVLFVVSNLKSASRILPLACDMSKQNKNRIHLMLTGRDDIAIEDIQKINGVTEADCSIRWHDGRPDFSVYSTDYRMEVSVRASLGHITSVMKPRVVLVDSPEREDTFFTTGIKDKTRDLGLPLIELPVNAAEQLQWISKLDGSSLKAWNEINIEILIHSPPESSGSLIRLLRSLESADYFGFPHPRLTIELPNNMDPPTSQFLSSFRWPPWSHRGNSKLTLRHRLLSNHLDATQASIRQLESFYPSNVPQSNVLVLSPQVELSPLYFHYLVYTLLDYKHSNTALHTSEGIMGISLERPFTTLSGKDSLSIPEEASSKPLFRYQAPNSNAALYFGDKWVELHSFLSNRFAVDKDLHKDSDAAYPISQAYPSWLNYVLELARARGYTMLYPTLSSLEAALATIHTELYHPPEEHSDHTTPTMAETPPSKETPLTASSEPIEITHGPRFEPPVASGSLLHLLNPKLSSSDSGGPLPQLSDLPILLYTGEYLPQGQVSLNQAAFSYAEDFSRDRGGCNTAGSSGGEEESEKKKKQQTRPTRKPWSADDLFCLEEGEMEGSLGVGRMPPSTQETEGAAQEEDGGEEHAGGPVDVDKDG